MNLDNIDINNLPDINEVLKKQGINTTKTIKNEENTITPIDDNLNQNYLNKVGKFWSKNEIFSPSYIRGNVEILKVLAFELFKLESPSANALEIAV